jgi:hypothetical protein
MDVAGAGDRRTQCISYPLPNALFKFQNDIGKLVDLLGNLTGSVLKSKVTHKHVKPKLYFEGS